MKNYGVFGDKEGYVGDLNVQKIISEVLWHGMSAVLKLSLYAVNAAVCTQGLILLLSARLLNSIKRNHILCLIVMEENA